MSAADRNDRISVTAQHSVYLIKAFTNNRYISLRLQAIYHFICLLICGVQGQLSERWNVSETEDSPGVDTAVTTKGQVERGEGGGYYQPGCGARRTPAR